jgi:hypothetical protein
MVRLSVGGYCDGQVMWQTARKNKKRRARGRALRSQADLVVTLSGLAATVAITTFILTGVDTLERLDSPWSITLVFVLVSSATVLAALGGLGYRLSSDLARERRRPRAAVDVRATVHRPARDPEVRRLRRTGARRETAAD